MRTSVPPQSNHEVIFGHRIAELGQFENRHNNSVHQKLQILKWRRRMTFGNSMCTSENYDWQQHWIWLHWSDEKQRGGVIFVDMYGQWYGSNAEELYTLCRLRHMESGTKPIYVSIARFDDKRGISYGLHIHRAFRHTFAVWDDHLERFQLLLLPLAIPIINKCFIDRRSSNMDRNIRSYGLDFDRPRLAFHQYIIQESFGRYENESPYNRTAYPALMDPLRGYLENLLRHVELFS